MAVRLWKYSFETTEMARKQAKVRQFQPDTVSFRGSHLIQLYECSYIYGNSSADWRHRFVGRRNR